MHADRYVCTRVYSYVYLRDDWKDAATPDQGGPTSGHDPTSDQDWMCCAASAETEGGRRPRGPTTVYAVCLNVQLDGADAGGRMGPADRPHTPVKGFMRPCKLFSKH